MSYEEQILLDLEWGEANANNEDVERVSENMSENSDEREVNCDEGGREEENGSPNLSNEISEVKERVRRPPMWMQDYVTREGLSEDEDLSADEANMALVVSTDPLHFEEIVKNENWRLVMDREINSIEKNKTWILTELPVGAK